MVEAEFVDLAPVHLGGREREGEGGLFLVPGQRVVQQIGVQHLADLVDKRRGLGRDDAENAKLYRFAVAVLQRTQRRVAPDNAQFDGEIVSGQAKAVLDLGAAFLLDVGAPGVGIGDVMRHRAEASAGSIWYPTRRAPSSFTV